MSMISNPAVEDRTVKTLRPKKLSATTSRRAGLSTLLIGIFLASALPLSVGVGTGNNAGYSDSGMNVTFTDDATDNIHFYQNVAGFSVSGGAQWKPDGRAINPLSSAASFDAAGTVMLSAFDGMNPNGDWTLVIADVSGGGGQTTVISWGLTAVPEPASMGLMFALALLTVPLAKQWRARRDQS